MYHVHIKHFGFVEYARFAGATCESYYTGTPASYNAERARAILRLAEREGYAGDLIAAK